MWLAYCYYPMRGVARGDMKLSDSTRRTNSKHYWMHYKTPTSINLVETSFVSALLARPDYDDHLVTALEIDKPFLYSNEYPIMGKVS